jgi:hypothetical protein
MRSGRVLRIETENVGATTNRSDREELKVEADQDFRLASTTVRL